MSAVAAAALSCGVGLLAVRGPAGRSAVGRARRGRRSFGQARAADDGLAPVLHAVAAQLRAGVEPGAAWAAALGQRPLSADALADALASVAVGRGVVRSGSHGAWGLRRTRRVPDARALRRAHAAAAAVRVADELGAPLAPALERIASAVALDEEDEADVGAAIAGPRATARLLGWLPALGLLAAAALGAHPVRVVAGGGPGTAAAVAGVGLMVLGRWWTVRLVRRVVQGVAP